MASLAITEAELLEALASATPGAGPDEARTAQELAAATGLTLRGVRAALKRFHVAGRLVPHIVSRPAIDGRASRVPAYTITPAV